MLKTAFNKTNPIAAYQVSRPHQKYETNPISPPRHPDYSLFTAHYSLFHETNPISTPTARPKTKMRETNPIYSAIYNLQYTIYNPMAQFTPFPTPIGNDNNGMGGYNRCFWAKNRDWKTMDGRGRVCWGWEVKKFCFFSKKVLHKAEDSV